MGCVWSLGGQLRILPHVSIAAGTGAVVLSANTMSCRSEAGNACADIPTGDCVSIELQAAPYLVKPNDAEAFALTGMKVDTPDDLVKAGRAICALGPEHVVISMGKAGAM
ncbi:MAG: bifunctional hydroxymethylpyrimidine kinase/phosphomethylpyrimidine kinase, partial [Deltaproteobacteria bacterium]|nr:bifunctional hydroxymethylpyrimidine kinase/phosphomethylpyrimidine kinase [Deltaproteobacteria bacterium]